MNCDASEYTAYIPFTQFAKITNVNFVPKVGPLVAEVLSGFTALLLAYFALPQSQTCLLHENSVLAAGALTLIAWLLGTFIDAFRNAVVEHIWDWLPSQKVNWKFLVHGDPTRVANYEHYFLSFYMIDVDMAIAIVLFLSVGPCVLSVITSQPVPHYSWERHALLVIVALVFSLDAFLLRKEIKDYMDENNQF
jgi:hypothetical protein